MMFTQEFSHLFLWVIGCQFMIMQLFREVLAYQIMFLGRPQTYTSLWLMFLNATLVVLLFAVYWYRIAGKLTKTKK